MSKGAPPMEFWIQPFGKDCEIGGFRIKGETYVDKVKVVAAEDYAALLDRYEKAVASLRNHCDKSMHEGIYQCAACESLEGLGE